MILRFNKFWFMVIEVIIEKDKGHKNEFLEFINSIKNGKPSPISIESIYYTTLTTFKIRESLRKSIPISIE